MEVSKISCSGLASTVVDARDKARWADGIIHQITLQVARTISSRRVTRLQKINMNGQVAIRNSRHVVATTVELPDAAPGHCVR